MHRQKVLSLLHAYASCATASHELAVATKTMGFVEAHADCLLRSELKGHLTGSAWVVDKTRRWTLLTHHRKLNKWLQLGGHADGDPDLLAVALREAGEESGLRQMSPVSSRIFDLDCHEIPARKDEPAHLHFDLRFMIEADRSELLVVTNESKALAWVEIAKVSLLNSEESMQRMVRKTLSL